MKHTSFLVPDTSSFSIAILDCPCFSDFHRNWWVFKTTKISLKCFTKIPFVIFIQKPHIHLLLIPNNVYFPWDFLPKLKRGFVFVLVTIHRYINVCLFIRVLILELFFVVWGGGVSRCTCWHRNEIHWDDTIMLCRLDIVPEIVC